MKQAGKQQNAGVKATGTASKFPNNKGYRFVSDFLQAAPRPIEYLEEFEKRFGETLYHAASMNMRELQRHRKVFDTDLRQDIAAFEEAWPKFKDFVLSHSPYIECSTEDLNGSTENSTDNQWQSFTDAELTQAVELMIAPSDLAIRGAAIALLETFSCTPSEVRAQIESGEYFNDGPAFDGLADTPRIIEPGN